MLVSLHNIKEYKYCKCIIPFQNVSVTHHSSNDSAFYKLIGTLHIFCGMEWAVDGIGVIRDIPSQRYTVFNVDTSGSDCLVHDNIAAADEDLTSIYSYRQHCGESFNYSKRLLL